MNAHTNSDTCAQATSEELRELKLKEDKKTKGFYVDQLSLHTVSNYARVKHLISVGMLLHFDDWRCHVQNDITKRATKFSLIWARIVLSQHGLLHTYTYTLTHAATTSSAMPENLDRKQFQAPMAHIVIWGRGIHSTQPISQTRLFFNPTVLPLFQANVSTLWRVPQCISSWATAGTELRTKAGTNMNELSSRSHSVFTIYLNQTHVCPPLGLRT